MTRDETAAFLRKFIEAWQKEDTPTLLGCYTENARLTSPMFHSLAGRTQLEKSYHDLFQALGDWQIQIDDIIVEGNRGVVAFTGHATQIGEIFGVPASGRRFESKSAFVMTFEGDRIAEETRIYDFTGMLVQLGILRAKAAI